jgi:C1A family cysteine protease
MFKALALSVLCVSCVSREKSADPIVTTPTASPTAIPTVIVTATPTIKPTAKEALSEIINLIETGKTKKQKYIARPVLSTADTLLLKGKTKGVSPDARSQQFATIPVTVSLKSLDTPIKDQGQEGLCTSFAVVAAMEMNAKNISKKTLDLSEKHLWNTYKQYYTISALTASTKNWITTETIWPYARSKSVSTIVPIAKNLSYKELTTWNDIFTALDAHKAVVLSADTNTSWSNPYKGVLLATGTKQGGHAIKVSGYFDTTKGRYLIIKNSWGSGYGDAGYVYLPQNYCAKYWCGFHLVDGTSLK